MVSAFLRHHFISPSSMASEMSRPLRKALLQLIPSWAQLISSHLAESFLFRCDFSVFLKVRASLTNN